MASIVFSINDGLNDGPGMIVSGIGNEDGKMPDFKVTSGFENVFTVYNSSDNSVEIYNVMNRPAGDMILPNIKFPSVTVVTGYERMTLDLNDLNGDLVLYGTKSLKEQVEDIKTIMKKTTEGNTISFYVCNETDVISGQIIIPEGTTSKLPNLDNLLGEVRAKHNDKFPTDLLISRKIITTNVPSEDKLPTWINDLSKGILANGKETPIKHILTDKPEPQTEET